MVTAAMLFHANSKAFISALTEGQRAKLIRAARESKPMDCMECIFFKWLFDADKCSKESCALGYDEEIAQTMKSKLCPVGSWTREE